MLLTDYLRSDRDLTWDYALQCGVHHAVIRLPEDPAFDPTNPAHWRSVVGRFRSAGLTPVVVEPLPNALHDHIKAGDGQADACIEAVTRMLAAMDQVNIRTLCFNFMAYVGWTRTDNALPDRGGARVTGFSLADYRPTPAAITAEQLWRNYTQFVQGVLPYAERYHIRLALHPDDPPLPNLGGVARIMSSVANIQRALDVGHSPWLGVTFCQACFHLMGADLDRLIPAWLEKIFFVHFRNVTGTAQDFRETFHDAGDLPMAHLVDLYRRCGIDVPVRVDHVPTMAGETQTTGYTALGRLYALGYLRGLLEGTACKEEST